MDALADVLNVTRISGSVLAHVHAHEPWGLDVTLANGAAFHAVTAGSIWLEAEGEPAQRLMPGDVVLLPTPGLRHLLLSTPGVAARRYVADLKAEREAKERQADLGAVNEARVAEIDEALAKEEATLADLEKAYAAEKELVDEIIDLHVFLKGFQGTLTELIQQPDHSRG